ncbi:hypothetical protein [Streptomyces inhibens]|uniref:hypothetical protein n=1 Tax=Streptomyces inhibens TaxID=2293571 RepID=UPI001EE71834|nr:hypothetical protein [Streptomyces inhibens]UKY48227.1 hypothetical protein KI385_05025 [Streptomyces inhibens]
MSFFRGGPGRVNVQQTAERTTAGGDAVGVIGGMRAWAGAGLPVVDQWCDGGSIA